MLKDRVVAGSIAGMTATLIKAGPNLLLWKYGIVKYLYFQIAGSALILPRDIQTPLGLAVGISADLITGGTIGIAAAIILKFFGNDYWWYKGLVIGNLVWLWGLGVTINFGAARLVPVDPLFRLTSLVDHLIFGLVTVYLIVRWYPGTKHPD